VNRVTNVYRKQTVSQADAQFVLITPPPIDDAARRTALADATLSYADRLFAELDRRQIGSSPDSWTTLVTGIHIDGHEAWVQIAVMGDPIRSLVVHLPEHVTAEHALAALASWQRSDEESTSPVINVLAYV
jgi:hypothetical protein